uniref:CCT domain-containing protein n=1 Tax=Leersia perrieri TaxID=77586 RepID=A0A0D9X3Y0_9ORYZ
MGNGGGGRRRKARRGGGGGVKKKKTKYLSLSRHLNLIKVEEDLGDVRSPELVVKEETPPSPELMVKEETPLSPEEDAGDRGEQQQMETFALFAAAPSLTDILGASSSSAAAGGGESSSPEVSGGTEIPGEEDDLARRALRGRERWVYCSSSSSPSATTATTTSSSSSSAVSTGASSGSDGGGGTTAARSLLLKLDYEEILAAWAGRGSLYIAAAAGEDHVAASKLKLDSVFVDVGHSPEPATAAAAAAETWSVAGTAARAEKVRRYKEKRNGRLFAKRIRYEVRRLNAVKRPRLKGRFIKEKEDVPMKSRRQLQIT